MTSSLRELFPNTQSVLIYPDDFSNKNVILEDFVERHSGHFSDQRLVVFFRPGKYDNINFPVGYWTQVLGLGETPSGVEFTGSLGVYCLPANTDNPDVGSLDTFWRSAENFTSNTTFIVNGEGPPCVPIVKDGQVAKSLTPPYTNEELYPTAVLPEDPSPEKGMLWAVSQAAPLRRIATSHNLHLSLGNNCASGGFISNVQVGRSLLFGSQQQFCVRNCATPKQSGGAWSIVMMGCDTDAAGCEDWIGSKPKNVICESLPKDGATIEKPFLFLNENSVLYLGIPKVKHGSNGVDHETLDAEEKVPVDNDEHVRIFSRTDSIADLQSAADRGIHIVLSPGIYNWGETLIISKHNQVVLGLGLATIQAPGDGSPCIHVRSQTQGVRLSGLSLEASVISKFIFKGSTLLTWGTPSDVNRKVSKDYIANPSVMHDLYCFVGGRRTDRTVKVECMVKIYSSHVIGDNLWLWRADHTKLMDGEQPNKPELSEYHVSIEGECRFDTGLEVFGDFVTFYGLAVEHTSRDMTLWHGRHGKVYFYQSELPYDVLGVNYSEHTSGYRVNAGADHHLAKGIGVYSYFRDCPKVRVKSAVSHHALLGEFQNVFTVWLNGYSGIESIVNNCGDVTKTPGKPFSIQSYTGEGYTSWYFWQGLWNKVRMILFGR
eukprot:scaffold688_cov105-Cylindrotheca_fusiformis.AAC.2